MKKYIFSTLFLVMLISNLVNADEVKDKQKTDEELIAQFMKSEEELQKAKAKTKALDELEKKVDELSKILQVDK